MDNDQKGKVYGLFKQAKEGDNTNDKPGMMSGFEASGKWTAWEANKGMSQDDAAAQYVTLVKEILGEWKWWNDFSLWSSVLCFLFNNKRYFYALKFSSWFNPINLWLMFYFSL